jgi:4-amino-4-deoxy-L-arabinose transferase-like glycosyltransferase
VKYIYGILSLLGIILPYSQLIPWIKENGLNISLFIEEAIQTRIGAFAWMDVLVSAVVLIAFIIYEGNRKGMKRTWIPFVGTLTVGVSLGLPLFLLLREIHLQKNEKKKGIFWMSTNGN